MSEPSQPHCDDLCPFDLGRMLRDLIAHIPAGRVTTFGRLAAALGDASAARWIAVEVAAWMVHPPAGADLPAHRVVKLDGVPSGAEEVQRLCLDRLRAEGVPVDGGRVVLEHVLHEPVCPRQPLAELREQQHQIAARVVQPPQPLPDFVGGLDVSYTKTAQACAAYVLIERTTGAVVWQRLRSDVIRFPYVPGYLSYREIPLYAPLMEEVRAAGRLAPVVLVDGNGRLHQRGAGIATHLGVALGLTTVGVGKSLLCGRVAPDHPAAEPDAAPVVQDDRVIATALRAPGRAQPLYVSVGHNIDLASATALVRNLWRDHRLPEPTYWADRLSRAALQGEKGRDDRAGEARAS